MCAYLKTYDKEITDMEQPLLVSRLKREVSLFCSLSSFCSIHQRLPRNS